MNFTTCMAAVAVADLDGARQFYGELFGRGPDQEPMPTLAQWDLPNGSAVQVVEDAGRAGTAMTTIVVGDFDETVAALRGKGLPLGEVIDGVLSRVVQLQDPAGNTLTLIEPPRGDRVIGPPPHQGHHGRTPMPGP